MSGERSQYTVIVTDDDGRRRTYSTKASSLTGAAIRIVDHHTRYERATGVRMVDGHKGRDEGTTLVSPNLPDQIDALPRNRRGYPVPWVAAWSSAKTPDRVMSRHDEELGPVTHCDCVIGEGSPDLGSVCYVRQMQAIMNRICGTCGTAITDGWFCWPSDTDDPNSNITEAPNHRECLGFALGQCPRLIRLSKEPKFAVVLTREYSYNYGRVLPDGTYAKVAYPHHLDHLVLELLFLEPGGERVSVGDLARHPAMMGYSLPPWYTR